MITQTQLLELQARMARNRARKSERCRDEAIESKCEIRDGIGLCDECGLPKWPQQYVGIGIMLCMDCMIENSQTHSVLESSAIQCEADQHREILKWAKFNGIAVRHSRMDTEHGEGNGEPDFLFMRNGKVCFVEQKFGKNKPSKNQLERQFEYIHGGIAGINSWTVLDTTNFVTLQLL